MINPYRNTFQDRLEELSLRREIEYEEMAKEVGMPVPNFMRLTKRNNNSVRTSSIEKIALGLDLIPLVIFESNNEYLYDISSRDSVMKYISKVFFDKRREIGLTQREVSNKIGWKSTCQVYSCEKGDRKSIELEAFELICFSLELTPRYLVERNSI